VGKLTEGIILLTTMPIPMQLRVQTNSTDSAQTLSLSVDFLPSNFHEFRVLKQALKFTMDDNTQKSALQCFRQILACASVGLLSKNV
jgi:hypothetical protein